MVHFKTSSCILSCGLGSEAQRSSSLCRA